MESKQEAAAADATEEDAKSIEEDAKSIDEDSPTEDIKHLNPALNPGARRIAIVGATNSGKTRALLEILPYFNIPDNLYIIIPYSVKKRPVYQSIIKYYNAYHVNIHTLSKISMIQKSILDNDKLDGTEYNLAIVDDFSDKKSQEAPELDALFSVGSHHRKLNVIMICQYFTNMTPSVRANLTDLYVFPSMRLDEIYKSSKLNFKSRDEFNRAYSECTTMEPDGKRHWLNINLEACTHPKLRVKRDMTEVFE